MRKLVFWLALLFLGVGLYNLLTFKNPPATQQLETNRAPTVSSGTSQPAQALEEALNTGKDFACTFKQNDENISGKIFVSNGKFRVDWQGTSDSHMIFSQGWYYVWSGLTLSLKTKSEGKTFADEVRSIIDPRKTSGLICIPWSIDMNFLEIPKDRRFVDVDGSTPASGSSTIR